MTIFTVEEFCNVEIADFIDWDHILRCETRNALLQN